MNSDIIITVSCEDRPRIVSSVAGLLADRGYTIRDSQQFGDTATGLFFLRVHASPVLPETDLTRFEVDFAVLAEQFSMTWELHRVDAPHRLLVMVSKQEHCLNDLLFRARTGDLAAEIVAVASNHEDLRTLVEWHRIPYHHIPVTPETKAGAEDQVRALVDKHQVDTVVLARYMQILSESLCADLEGRAINIHHSLLPSFKGARPYFQAHARGVKVIGATAHYVTSDLDEGPIIEQAFDRVDHQLSALDLTRVGQDLEALALARAVSAHAEHRVLRNGSKTVVFRG